MMNTIRAVIRDPFFSLDFAEKSIQCALTKVSRKRLFWYPLLWTHMEKPWRFPKGEGIGNEEPGCSLANSEKVIFDWILQVICYDYGRKRKIKTVINGQSIDAGTYTIWFENGESIKRQSCSL